MPTPMPCTWSGCTCARRSSRPWCSATSSTASSSPARCIGRPPRTALRARAADEGIHQLAFAIIAMANDYCVSREFIRMLAPRSCSRRRGAHIVDRLVGYSTALLAHEIASRACTAPGNRRPARKPGRIPTETHVMNALPRAGTGAGFLPWLVIAALLLAGGVTSAWRTAAEGATEAAPRAAVAGEERRGPRPALSVSLVAARSARTGRARSPRKATSPRGRKPRSAPSCRVSGHRGAGERRRPRAQGPDARDRQRPRPSPRTSPGARRGGRSRGGAGRGPGQCRALARPRVQGLPEPAGGDPVGDAEQTAAARLAAARARVEGRGSPAGQTQRARARRRHDLRARGDRRLARATRAGAVPAHPRQPAGMACRGDGKRARAPRARNARHRAPADRRRSRGHGAHDRADRRPADAQRDRLRRPAGRRRQSRARRHVRARRVRAGPRRRDLRCRRRRRAARRLLVRVPRRAATGASRRPRSAWAAVSANASR